MKQPIHRFLHPISIPYSVAYFFHIFRHITFLSVFILIAGTSAYADTIPSAEISRPVTGTYAIEIGKTSALLTYLSPLKYTGTTYNASGYWTKAMPFNPRHAIMAFKADISFSSLLNPAHSASMLGIYGDFAWGMAWRTKIPGDIQLTTGGDVQIAGGAYYLIRNSNNPVEAIGNASIDLSASISRIFYMGRLPVLISDRISIPSLSMFFSPQYGETYYEIYLGNRSGLVHAGWWGNNFRIDNLLSATLDFGRTAMTIGYRFKAYTQWACNLNTKIFSHSFFIGVVPGGIGIRKKAKVLPEETIYAIY